jgi:hypothetical protein
MRESDIEDYLCERVRAMGGGVRKVRFLDANGAPDRLVMFPEFWDVDERTITPAWCVWVELKGPDKRAEPHQLEQHKALQALGQTVVVINSLEGVDRLLA